MNVTIVAEKGTYLLVARNDRFALVERRNSRLYSCHGGKRSGIPLDDLSAAVCEIVDEGDWVSRPTAQAALDEAGSRWTDLAEHMR
jgi:hypothetical protein